MVDEKDLGQEKKTSFEEETKREALLLPTVSGLPVVTQIISSVTAESLAQKSPEELLRFVESYDERQLKFYSLKEENRHKQKLEQEKTKRLGMGFVFATIAAVMVYSGVTGDKSLSEKIINVAIGALGGLGAGVVFLKPKNED